MTPRSWAALALALMLVGCGAGEGSNLSSTANVPPALASTATSTIPASSLPYVSPTPTPTPTPSPTPLPNPWPMFHGNTNHSGQSTNDGPQTATEQFSLTEDDVTSGTVFNSPSVALDGTIYLTGANKLLAVSDTGDLLWSDVINGNGGTAVSADGSTVYACGGNNLFAVTADEGTAVWTFAQATDVLNGEPTVGGDGTVYVGSWDTHEYAVTPAGQLKWSFQTDGSIAPLGSAALSPDGTTLYVGGGDPNKTADGNLYALTASAGALKWKVKVDPTQCSGAAVDAVGTVYVAGGGSVSAFNASGDLMWTSAAGTASHVAPAVTLDGTVYVGNSTTGKLYALDAASGATRWSYQTAASGGTFGITTTPVVGADDVVYVGAVDGRMYAIGGGGAALWTFQTGGGVQMNCPAVSGAGALYFSSADKKLYAIHD